MKTKTELEADILKERIAVVEQKIKDAISKKQTNCYITFSDDIYLDVICHEITDAGFKVTRNSRELRIFID